MKICLFILLLCANFSSDDESKIILEKTTVSRTIVSESVSASYDANTIIINVSGYTGIVCYEIESIDGEGGFLSGSQAVYGNGTVSVSTMSLDAGSYTIWIRAGYEYIGSFDI